METMQTCIGVEGLVLFRLLVDREGLVLKQSLEALVLQQGACRLSGLLARRARPLRAQHLPGRQISIHLRARPGASAIAHQAWGGAEFREIEAPVMQHQCQNVKLPVGPYGQ